MKRSAAYNSLLSLTLVAVISCSGSSGTRNAKAGETPEAAAGSDTRPARRLIEVLAPADNASFTCNGNIVFSVAHAA